MKIIKILVSSLFLFVLLGGNLWAEPRVYHGQGRLLLESGDYLGALDQFNRALEINPQYADALTGLAESYYFLGEYNESLRFFTEAESLKQLSPGEEALMGRALLGMGQPQDAWEVLERVLEREPGNREARFAQAEYFAINLQFNQSARRFGQLLAEQPQDLRALLSLIYLHHSQGVPDPIWTVPFGLFPMKPVSRKWLRTTSAVWETGSLPAWPQTIFWSLRTTVRRLWLCGEESIWNQESLNWHGNFSRKPLSVEIMMQNYGISLGRPRRAVPVKTITEPCAGPLV